VGRRLAGLPSWLLVGFASFRLVLELFMHAAAAEGTMPVQMTFGAGLNYDILTGASALVVAAQLRRHDNPVLLRAWNVFGLALLVSIVTIAVVSTPAIAAFGPHRLNTWVAYAPFIWMITVNVPAALLGHLVNLPAARRRARTRSAVATSGRPGRGQRRLGRQIQTAGLATSLHLIASEVRDEQKRIHATHRHGSDRDPGSATPRGV
jgi:hypothetical protein